MIDNCEHLLDAVRDVVVTLLEGCPELTVLATSREPIGLAAECPSRLAPLPLPDRDGAGAGSVARVPSVAMFLERAARVRRGFDPDAGELRVVADIVRGLDGMPLAIELAAGRLSTFSLADLRDRLGRSLDLFGVGRPTVDSRHRTLRATVEWSYDLLSEDERRLFRHLSVFADGVDLATAEDIATGLVPSADPGSALAHLVDASMIDALIADDATGGGTRYRMLETLRAFGLDRLAATGEQAAASRRLLAWARDITSWINSTITTENEPRADAELRREMPNLRVAWRLARNRANRDDAALDDAVAIVAALHEASIWRDVPEIRGWAEELADDPAMAAHPRVATVLATAARAAYMRGDHAEADRRARAAVERATDDQERWLGQGALAMAYLARGAFREAVDQGLAAASLATRPSGSLGVAALAATYAGEPDRARAFNDRMAADATSPTLRAFAAYVAGEIDSATGLPASAEQRYSRAIDVARSSGATFIVGIASVGLLTVLVDAGRTADALHGYHEVIDYFARSGNWPHLWTTLRNLARLLRELGEHEPATLLDAAADHAPDAPPVRGSDGRTARPVRQTPPVGRTQALEVARQAIARNLARS